MEKMFTSSFEIKASKEDDRTINFIASSEIVDRDREIIKLAGMDLKQYKKNPVILFSHQRGSLPIGKAVSIVKSKGQLKMKVEFADEETYPFGYQVYKLVKNGFLNACSIGFSVDWSKIEYDEKKNVRIFNKTELLELSIVSIGANQDALATGKSINKAFDDGIITEEELKSWDKYLDDKDPNEELMKELQDRVGALEQKLEHSDSDDTDSYFDDIMKEFKSAGGTDNSEPDTIAKDLDDLLDVLKEDK